MSAPQLAGPKAGGRADLHAQRMTESTDVGIMFSGYWQ
jgi:hypothetical protein